jgi:hypothetical protein
LVILIMLRKGLAVIYTTCVNSRIASRFYRWLSVSMALIFAVLAAASLGIWFRNIQYSRILAWVNLLWLAYGVFSAFTLKLTANHKYCAALIFLLALAPRLTLALLQPYTPTNDFSCYWEMGAALLQGDPSVTAYFVNHYQTLEFAGLGVINAATQFLSGGTMMGYQILLTLVTSTIAVLVYQIGKRFHPHVGVIAALLYALYPSNIVMTQVFTNQHLATLLALLSLLFFLKGFQSRTILHAILYGSAAGILLLLSQYAHPSALVTRIAFAVYAILLCVELRKNRALLFRSLCVLIACLLVYTLGYHIANQVMIVYKLRDASTVQYRYSTFILVGLDYTTYGRLDELEKYRYMMMTPQEAWAEIWVRIKNPFQLIGLLVRKAARMWGSMDTSFHFYTDDLNNTPFQQRIASAFGALDGLYTAAAYLLAAAGLFLSRNKIRALALPLIVLAGWFSIFLFSEIQPRYRYYGMTFVIVFAAVGCYLLMQHYHKCVYQAKTVR